MARLGGVTEVAEVLGVSRQRLLKLRERRDFPAPLADLAQGPVWDLDAVGMWDNSGLRRTSPGRPPSVEGMLLGGRFLLEELPMASGGFAEVFRATDLRPVGAAQRVVAVKKLKSPRLYEPTAIRRFQRELRLMTGISHPHVMPILECATEHDDEVWYAMPLAQSSLADIMSQFHNRPDMIMDTMRQICAGLSHVHGQGILHRDLKPDNILFVGPGTLAIADFGLAMESVQTTTTLTSTRAGMGTPWYSAPEQFDDAHQVDHRADVFSLGRILQEMIIGSRRDPVPGELGVFESVVSRATGLLNRRYLSVTEFLAAAERALSVLTRQWEAPEDVARWYLERVKAPVVDHTTLLGFLDWAQQLGADKPDQEALLSVLPYLAQHAIKGLWDHDHGAFRVLYLSSASHIAVARLRFDFCDVVTDFCIRVCITTQDAAVLRATVKALTEMGTNHTRWYVRNTLSSLLQQAREPVAMAAVLDGLRDAWPDAVRWTFEFSQQSMHPVIRDGIAEIIDSIRPVGVSPGEQVPAVW